MCIYPFEYSASGGGRRAGASRTGPGGPCHRKGVYFGLLYFLVLGCHVHVV